jgi:hypothetical protein
MELNPAMRILLLVSVGCTLLLGGSGAARAADPARPNFLVLIADDMGYDECGAYGHKTIRTPNLDKLARDGRQGAG